MAASVISISSDSSDESIYSEVLVVPEVAAATVASPARSDIELPERHVSFSSHDAMVARWRSKVASRSSSPTTSTSEIPTAPIPRAPYTEIIEPVVAPLEVCRCLSILIRPGQDILVDRLYRTHPGGPCRALTVRKSVGPLPFHRLALRYTSHHLDRFTSGSSSNHSSSDHSSFDHSSSNHSSSEHFYLYTIRDLFDPLLAGLHVFNEGLSHWTVCHHYLPVSTNGHPSLRWMILLLESSCQAISQGDLSSERLHRRCVSDIRRGLWAVGGMAATSWDIEAGIDAGIGIEVEVDPRAGPVVDDDMLHGFHDHIVEIPVHRIQVIESVQRFQGHRIAGVDLEATTITERISALERDNARLRYGNDGEGCAENTIGFSELSRVIKSELSTNFVGFVYFDTVEA
ncbi:hypothetical protein Tco_0680710 [Tanacetum coccineum]|uniref:Uncharacterized protein n=1 Tax=Tanacetum coccineum TaxID=301880 RepID=A0ABQ4XM62_9ASTR